MSTLEALLRDGPVAVAVGAHDFAEALRQQDVEVVEVDWRPPYEPDEEAARLLEALL